MLQESSPFPLPAHRTGRADFPHPALRLASWQAHDMAPALRHARAQHTKRAEHRVHTDMPATARRQLVTPGEEVAHVVIQVRLDCPVYGVVGATRGLVIFQAGATWQSLITFAGKPSE